MLGIRSFACDECDTVYADIEEPPRCPDCGGRPVVELTAETQALDYFAPARGQQF